MLREAELITIMLIALISDILQVYQQEHRPNLNLWERLDILEVVSIHLYSSSRSLHA